MSYVFRGYFPNTGPAPPVSPAVGAAWELSAGLVRRTLGSSITNTNTGNDTRSETSATPVDYVFVQYVTAADVLPTGAISGTFSYAGKFGQGLNAGALAYMRIAVVSNDGTVERGELYAGVATAGNIPIAPVVCIWDNVTLTGGITFQSGDRVVVELGIRFTNTSTTSRDGTVQTGDDDNDPDYPLVAETPAGGRPWIEFNIASVPSVPKLSESHTADSIIASWQPSTWGAAGYEVRIDGGTPIDTETELNHTFTGLTPGVHTVEARAYNVTGYSAWGSIQVTTDAPSAWTPAIPQTGAARWWDETAELLHYWWDDATDAVYPAELLGWYDSVANDVFGVTVVGYWDGSTVLPVQSAE